MVCKVQLLIRNSRAALKEIQNRQNCCCLLLYHSVFSSVCCLPLYFLSFFPLHEDHAVPFHFVHLPLHFLKQQESRSQDHLCEFKWEQKGVSESWEYFCPPTSTPEAQSVRSQVWSRILDWLERDVLLHHSGSVWGSMEEG